MIGRVTQKKLSGVVLTTQLMPPTNTYGALSMSELRVRIFSEKFGCVKENISKSVKGFF